VPIERINRYKQSVPLQYRDQQMEERYQRFQRGRGRSTSIFGLIALMLVALGFAFIEHWVLGLKSSLPLMVYLGAALVAAAGALFSTVSDSTASLKLRLLLPGALVLVGLLLSLHFEGYRLYHGFQMGLLLIWLGSLNSLGFRWISVTVGSLSAAFTGLAWLYGADEIKLPALVALLFSSLVLALFVSYLLERFRRMLYLTQHAMKSLSARQESWAYTLIDLDMALSGITELRQLLERLMEYIGGVIPFDSFVLTTLEGKSGRPKPEVVEGTLFEAEEATLWNDDLISRLTQTRQALASADFDWEEGFLGRQKKRFKHYRLDIPVFDGSNMVALISLRRASEPYDELDMTASISLTAQAMMIYKRSLQAGPAKVVKMSESLVRGMTPEQLAQQARSDSVAAKAAQPVSSSNPEALVESDPSAVNIQVSADSTRIDATDMAAAAPPPKAVKPDEEVAPSELVRKLKKETESARKTITLLSRENADRVAVDRYRSAALEGEPLSILLVEVDGLSQLREKDGDKAAYKVFAGIIRHVFSKLDPQGDVLGRYGQNGFSVLLHRVDMNAAEKFAESIRRWVETARFKTPYGERSATLSIGVAAITEETGNYESMVKRADMALFVAKKSGRNCVKVRL
jgi:diguanylate cyclase (GGDEF)-like protein